MLSLLTGRRSKYAVFAFWFVVTIVAGAFGASRLTDAQENDTASFLPASADSTKVANLQKDFQDLEPAPAVIVFRRADGPITPADQAAIDRDRQEIDAKRFAGAGPVTEPQRSPDGTAVVLTMPYQVDSSGGDKIVTTVKDIRAIVADGRPEGLDTYVTGGAGFAADAIEVFSSIDGVLLLAAAAVVIVMLLLTYRSPFLWLVPLVSVLFAVACSQAMAYVLTLFGVTVNGQSAGILNVLVFGAGTDYALLIVARYREELHTHEDRHEAMRLALRQAGPPIIASAATVIAALLCLLVADLNSTAGLGPIAAMGIAVTCIVMLTVLPPLLLIATRGAFWPYVPHFGDATTTERGIFGRLGTVIARRPRGVWIVTTLVLLVGAVGLVQYEEQLTQNEGYRTEVESQDGQGALQAAGFPAGLAAPTDIYVSPASEAPAAAAAAVGPQATSATPIEVNQRGTDVARFQVFLAADPYSEQALPLIPALRDRVSAAAPGALVGGPTAAEVDLRSANSRDTKLILPLILLVVLVILGILLRAITAPVILVATVVVSLAAALGVGTLVSLYVFDFPSMAPGILLFAFLFLVALGVDYNIFLMARVREEAARIGTRAGMRKSLAVTGAVITSAGLVLAGTFATLGTLNFVFLTELGLIVALGVLLDTFVVRTILVPAITLDVGPRIWWPSALADPAADAQRSGEPSPPAGHVPGRPSPEPT